MFVSILPLIMDYVMTVNNQQETQDFFYFQDNCHSETPAKFKFSVLNNQIQFVKHTLKYSTSWFLMEPWGTIAKSAYDGMLERFEHLSFMLNREM